MSSEAYADRLQATIARDATGMTNCCANVGYGVLATAELTCLEWAGCGDLSGRARLCHDIMAHTQRGLLPS
jgi:hypothetical protein